MNDELKHKQMEAVLTLMNKVLSDYEHELSAITANDLVAGFNRVCQAPELENNPQVAVGAFALLMDVLATTNNGNDEFMEKMNSVLSLM